VLEFKRRVTPTPTVLVTAEILPNGGVVTVVGTLDGAPTPLTLGTYPTGNVVAVLASGMSQLACP
jgi:hypothetical protein